MENIRELKMEIARAEDKMTEITRQILFLDYDKEKENDLILEHNKIEVLHKELVKKLKEIV